MQPPRAGRRCQDSLRSCRDQPSHLLLVEGTRQESPRRTTTHPRPEPPRSHRPAHRSQRDIPSTGQQDRTTAAADAPPPRSVPGLPGQQYTRAGAIRTLASLARIEAGAEGGALIERTTTTRTAKSGATTTTVRERFTPPDWRADGWFLERRHPVGYVSGGVPGDPPDDPETVGNWHRHLVSVSGAYVVRVIPGQSTR